MKHQNQVTRKTFLRILSGLTVGLLVWLWYQLTGNQSESNGVKEYRHANVPVGISFFGKYYLIRTRTSVMAFSTTCTHAGCRLRTSNTEIITCGCHGSQFDAKTGKPLKGPASRPLQQWDCSFDSTVNQWVVKYSNPSKS